MLLFVINKNIKEINFYQLVIDVSKVLRRWEIFLLFIAAQEDEKWVVFSEENYLRISVDR